MKNSIFLALAIPLVFGSCAAPAYLPDSTMIDVNPYGGYIEVVHVKYTEKNGKVIKESDASTNGELIAVDRDTMTILSQKDNHIIQLPVKDVTEYTLRYAKPKAYGWSIPLYLLLTASHGLGLVLTAPVNLITTIAVTSSGANAFKYSDDNLKIKDLSKFARFPQGLPPSIHSLSEIKPYVPPKQ